MNKKFFMNKRFLAIAISAILLLTITVIALSVPAPKDGFPSWKDSYRTASLALGGANGKPVNNLGQDVNGAKAPVVNNYGYNRTISPRTNASGDKITSNAHSGDYPGVYFYWNDKDTDANKQKHDGVFLIAESVFDMFKGETVILTVKNSNAYWDYYCVKDAKFIVGSEGGENIYGYRIPRYYMMADKKGNLVKEELKNINMVFISSNYKDGEFKVKKIWQDEFGRKINGDDGLVKFREGYVLGKNTVKFASYKEAYYGRDITVTENPIKGFETLVNPQKITVKAGDNPIQVLTFTNRKQWANIIIIKEWRNKDGFIMPNPTTARATFKINGAPAVLGGSGNIVRAGTYTIAEDPIEGFRLYNITGRTDSISLRNRTAVVTVAAGETKVVTFINKEKYTPPPPTTGVIELLKLLKESANGRPELWDSSHPLFAEDNPYIFFDIYDYDPVTGITGGSRLATSQVSADGIIRFNNLTPGNWYTIVERFEFPADHPRKYEQALTPMHVQAWDENDPHTVNFSPKTFGTNGILNQRDVILSTDKDTKLKMYEWADYFGDKTNSAPVLIDNTVLALSDIQINPYWRSRMELPGGNFFQTLGTIEFEANDGNTYIPDFIWNTKDFYSDQIKARDGDTVIFEKTFTLLESLVDKNGNALAAGAPVNLFITADNAFVIFINGSYVGHSYGFVSGWSSVLLNQASLNGVIGNRGHQFLPNVVQEWTWSQVYTFDIRNKLILNASNTITIVAINGSEWEDAGSTVSVTDYYNNPQSNPAGVIFGCEIYSQSESYRFINKLLPYIPPCTTEPTTEPSTCPTTTEPSTCPTTTEPSTCPTTTEPSTCPTTTEPSTCPTTTEPSTCPTTTEPSTCPTTTEPSTCPTTTEPSTCPTTQPSTCPTTQPSTCPTTTEPSTCPTTTEPSTCPTTTEPSTCPTTQPSTCPTTQPSTCPTTTEPSTCPTTTCPHQHAHRK